MSGVPRLTPDERVERITYQIDAAEDQYFETQERLCVLLAELYRLGKRHEAMEFLPVDDFLDDDDARRWELEYGQRSAPVIRLAVHRGHKSEVGQ